MVSLLCSYGRKRACDIGEGEIVELLDGVRTMAQEESVELHLVRDAFKSRFPPTAGSFLHHLCMAFLKSDRENFNLLLPVMKEIIRKCALECNCANKGG